MIYKRFSVNSNNSISTIKYFLLIRSINRALKSNIIIHIITFFILFINKQFIPVQSREYFDLFLFTCLFVQFQILRDCEFEISWQIDSVNKLGRYLNKSCIRTMLQQSIGLWASILFDFKILTIGYFRTRQRMKMDNEIVKILICRIRMPSFIQIDSNICSLFSIEIFKHPPFWIKVGIILGVLFRCIILAHPICA